jgi:hypothetical protein
VRLDLLERHAVDARLPAIRFRESIGVRQNVRPVDFVVQPIKPEGRLGLGLYVQLALKRPDR